MKRLYLLLAMLIAISATGIAQTNGLHISMPYPDIAMKILRCSAADKIVVIDFIIENRGSNDIEFEVGGGESAAYDDEGNVYDSTTFLCSFGLGPLKSVYSNRQKCPSNVPVKGRIQLEGVPDYVQTIRRIDLRTNTINNVRFIKITNIPVFREGD